MAVLPTSSSSLDLTISVLGFPSSGTMSDLDINQVPEEAEENQWMMTTTFNASVEEGGREGGSSSGPPRKKLRLTKEQSRLLEESFRLNHTLNPMQKQALAVELKLKPRQVEVWFQNRRARSKLKQTEKECEYLKRWFGSLTEQNRRLQREVEELRAMKIGPLTALSPHSREPLLGSTLTMCPRCEHVTAAAKAPTLGAPATNSSAKVPVLHT